MTEAVLVALITGGLTLIGVWIQNRSTINQIIAEQDKRQAVMESKLEELTREVRAHNGFAQRMPVVEAQITNLTKRVEKLEDDGK